MPTWNQSFYRAMASQAKTLSRKHESTKTRKDIWQSLGQVGFGVHPDFHFFAFSPFRGFVITQ